MKKTFARLFALLLAVSLGLTAWASATRVVDESGLLDTDQRQELETRIAEITAAYNFDVVLLTVDDLGAKSATAYADDFYQAGGYGAGPDRDGILMLVSLGQRDWVIYTYGRGKEVFTDYGNDMIARQMVPHLSDGDYYGAFSVFLSMSEDFLHKAQNDQPYDVDNPVKTAGNIPLKITLSLLGALLVAGIVTAIMKSQLNSARPQAMAHDYISHFDLRVQRDVFLYSRTSRIKRVQNNGGPGGSTTHRSSGGGSFGGSSGKF